MSDIILPSKLVSERITVTFDFQDELSWGEGISSWDVTVGVVSGVDASPDVLLYSSPTKVGTLVSQRIQLGTPGVIYKIICSAVGDTGAVYNKSAYLAILRDNALNPPILGRVFTSKIYPIDLVDSLLGGAALVDIKNLSAYQFDELLGGLEFLSLDIYGGIVAHAQPADSLTSDTLLLSVNIYGGIVSHTQPADSMLPGITLMAADIWGSAVAHTQPIEALAPNSTLLSVTIS